MTLKDGLSVIGLMFEGLWKRWTNNPLQQSWKVSFWRSFKDVYQLGVNLQKWIGYTEY